ncbi:chemotaxis protein [Anopheles sinensis]|uniref:Chemotaxis protein n=1 Tax=Anopheles sinensis TaxID=74873 RepID=A0A084WC19_ANOSI|nr:chemotaxis protein [Anopheles sinensis]
MWTGLRGGQSTKAIIIIIRIMILLWRVAYGSGKTHPLSNDLSRVPALQRNWRLTVTNCCHHQALECFIITRHVTAVTPSIPVGKDPLYYPHLMVHASVPSFAYIRPAWFDGEPHSGARINAQIRTH